MKEITTADKIPYRNRARWTKGKWLQKTIIIRNVPISYMKETDCALFVPALPSYLPTYPGDTAVIEFQDQDWSKPRVIGKEYLPRATQANFYIGPSTSPFSEYTRDEVAIRTMRYFGGLANSRLADLSGGNIKLLILPCPIRVLSDAELTAIQSFRGGGGRVAFFAGRDLEKANDVLNQLGSQFEILPTYDAVEEGVYIISGICNMDDAPTMFWIAANPTGWISKRQSFWSAAPFKDMSGFGLAYNDVTAVIYDTYLIQQSYPYSSLYMTDIMPDLIDSPPTWDDVEWAFMSLYFPAGHVAEYPEGKAALYDWLAANTSFLPYSRMAQSGWSMPTIWTPYGNVWNLESARAYVDFFGALCAYASDNLIVCSFRLDMLTNAVGDPDAFDYYFWPVQFFDWLINGKLTQHDFFQRGWKFVPWSPYQAKYMSGGIGFLPGTMTGG